MHCRFFSKQIQMVLSTLSTESCVCHPYVCVIDLLQQFPRAVFFVSVLEQLCQIKRCRAFREQLSDNTSGRKVKPVYEHEVWGTEHSSRSVSRNEKFFTLLRKYPLLGSDLLFSLHLWSGRCCFALAQYFCRKSRWSAQARCSKSAFLKCQRNMRNLRDYPASKRYKAINAELDTERSFKLKMLKFTLTL